MAALLPYFFLKKSAPSRLTVVVLLYMVLQLASCSSLMNARREAQGMQGLQALCFTVSACSPVAAWAAAFTEARTVKQLDARGAVVTNTTESRDDCRFHALVTTTHSKVHVRCPAEGRRQALTGAAGGGIGIGAPLHSRSPRTEQ